MLRCVLAGASIVSALLMPQTAPAPSPASDVQRLLDKAMAALREDLYQDAMDAAASAVDKDEGSAPAHVVLADALYRRGDFEEAERHYRRGVALDPDNAAAHYGVGRILRTLGRYGDAAESFARAAALAPQVPKYLRTLANHLARREDEIAMLTRYLELARAATDPNLAEEATMIRNTEAWLALLHVAGDRPISQLAKKEPCAVRLQVARGQAYLKMTVAGLKDQRFVFDTGATGLTISPRVAARARLAAIRPFTIAGTGSKNTETGDLVLIDEISLGSGIVVRNVPATVRDPAGPEEGLVGPSLFAALNMTVDLNGGRLSFANAAVPDVPPGALLMPFRNVGGEIVVTARVNDTPFNALVDTGASSTIIGRATLARTPGLTAIPGQWAAGVTVGVGGPLADRRVILAGTLAFAGRTYPADGLISGNLSGFSRALESEVYVILGAQHLDDFVMTISFHDMTVSFIPRAAAR